MCHNSDTCHHFCNDFSVRKWKTKTTLGADKKWEFEVGENLSLPSPMETSYIVESRSNVSLVAMHPEINY